MPTTQSLRFGVAVQLQDSAQVALNYALRALLRDNCKITMISALPPQVAILPSEKSHLGQESPSTSIPDPISGAIDAAAEYRESLVDSAQAALTAAIGKAEEEVKRRGLQHVTLDCELIPGVGGASGVGASIADFASSRGLEFLVMGTRSLSVVGRFFYDFIGAGSVSDYVAKHSSIPVLVVGPGTEVDETLALHGGPGTGAEGGRGAPGREADPEAKKSKAEAPAAGPGTVSSLASVGEASQGLTRICVGIDGTPEARAALNLALRLAGPKGVLHVACCGEVHESVVALLDQTKEALVGSGAISEDRLITCPLPGTYGPMDISTRLQDHCIAHSLGLIVVGWSEDKVKAKSVLSLIGLGSTAEYMLHHPGRTPVLFTKHAVGLEALSEGESHVWIPAILVREETISAVPEGQGDAAERERDEREGVGELAPTVQIKPAGHDRVTVSLVIERASGGGVISGERTAQGTGPEPAQPPAGSGTGASGSGKGLGHSGELELSKSEPVTGGFAAPGLASGLQPDVARLGKE